MGSAAWRKTFGIGWQVLVLIMLVGCSRSSGVPRLPVYGTITHPGGEKIDGSVSFVPDQGRSGPGAVTSLVKGEYRFDTTNGPLAGPHRVIVTRAAGKGMLLKQGGASKGQPAALKDKDAAGARQVNEWKFSADIPANGPYQFDFKLP